MHILPETNYGLVALWALLAFTVTIGVIGLAYQFGADCRVRQWLTYIVTPILAAVSIAEIAWTSRQTNSLLAPLAARFAAVASSEPISVFAPKDGDRAATFDYGGELDDVIADRDAQTAHLVGFSRWMREEYGVSMAGAYSFAPTQIVIAGCLATMVLGMLAGRHRHRRRLGH